MTEDFNTETFRYLLDELGKDERAAFERLLERDPAARVALKECSAGVARFACEVAPAEAMLPTTQRAALAHILASMALEPRVPRPAFPWRRILWPLAAAVLLGLNLLQFFHSASPELPRNHHPVVHEASAQSSGVVGNFGDRIHPAGKTAEANASGLRAENASDPHGPAALHRLEKLRAESSDLKHESEALSAEYENGLRQLALVASGRGRLDTMELVDAGSYARGERHGLVDVAPSFLTEPEIVAIGPQIASTLPTAPPAVSVPAGITPGAAPGSSTPDAVVPPATGVPPSAWSVFDEIDSRGYLNLYNLPAVPVDQSLQLWVKPANADTYQLVGEVPKQFYGNSGSLIYSLPGATLPPTEILITQEPRNALPTQPLGPTVLRGP